MVLKPPQAREFEDDEIEANRIAKLNLISKTLSPPLLGGGKEIKFPSWEYNYIPFTHLAICPQLALNAENREKANIIGGPGRSGNKLLFFQELQVLTDHFMECAGVLFLEKRMASLGSPEPSGSDQSEALGAPSPSPTLLVRPQNSAAVQDREAPTPPTTFIHRLSHP